MNVKTGFHGFYDFEADAVYYYVHGDEDSSVDRTLQVGGVLFDFGSENELLGFEVLSPSDGEWVSR